MDQLRRRPPLRMPPSGGFEGAGPRRIELPELDDIAQIRQRMAALEASSRQASHTRVAAILEGEVRRLRRRMRILTGLSVRIQRAGAAQRRFEQVLRQRRVLARGGWVGIALLVLTEVALRSLRPKTPPKPPVGPLVRQIAQPYMATVGREIIRQQGEALAQSALIPSSLVPPTPSMWVDTRGFGQALQRYWQVVGGDLAKLLHDQTRLVVERCVDLTPPFSGKRLTRMLKGGDFGRTTAKKIGENRVERDIRRVFVPVNKLRVWKTYKGFKEAVEKQDAEVIRIILQPAFNFAEIAPNPNPALHQSQRNARGNVRRRPRQQLVLNSEAVATYAKTRQKRVGYAKAGWSTAARKFGAKLPAWIGRHNAPGSAEDLTAQEPIRTRIGNAVPYIQAKGRELKIMELALDGQAKSMESNIRRILKNRSNSPAKNA